MVPKIHNYLMHGIEYISATARLLIRRMGCHRLQNNCISILEVQVYILSFISEKKEGERRSFNSNIYIYIYYFLLLRIDY